MANNNTGTIVELNRVAVSNLKSSRNRNAYEMFHHGLQVMHDIIQHRQVIQSEPMECDGSSSELTSVTTVELSCSQTDMLYSPDNFFHIYENAFLVPKSAKAYMHPYAFQDLVSAVLMYNTGLLCHRQGLEIGNFRMLERALFLYEMAASTVQQDASYKSDDIDGLFMLALTNNMGHIHSHMFCQEKADFCRRLLEDLISDELLVADCVEDATHCHFFIECLQFREFGLILAPAA